MQEAMALAPPSRVLVVVVVLLVALQGGIAHAAVEVNVDSYGAVGDGEHDDTAAFQRAWAAACGSPAPATLVVPEGRSYLLKQITFRGQCSSMVTFKLEGTLVAPASRSSFANARSWVVFTNVDHLTVAGGGTMDGKGDAWWRLSCRVDKRNKCSDAPTALLLHRCNHLRVESIRLLNSQQMHVAVMNCAGVTMRSVRIEAPGDSPNTDGIHISHTRDMVVAGSVIGTGDDCISVETGTENLLVTNTTCGPGHGISIGSLGDGNSEARVANVTVRGARLNGTTNGARIKTWQGGSGYAKDIRFEDMAMIDVRNPIIIDQNYCTMADPLRPKPCQQQVTAVEVSRVQFRRIKGTSASKDAIRLDCSATVPCRDIRLEDVRLRYTGDRKDRPSAGAAAAATSVCNNVEIRRAGSVLPFSC